jgi:hypothetical protein
VSTPEAAVKAKIKAALKQHNVYFFMPATHGYGSSGTPDIVCLWNKLFIGIEVKANRGKPTALQLKNLRQIRDEGGAAILVDETGIGMFTLLLSTWAAYGPEFGRFYNMTKHDDIDLDTNKIETD